MCMMMENLEYIEMHVYTIKALMKEPDFALFEDIKRETQAKVLQTQALMNPKLASTAAAAAASAPK